MITDHNTHRLWRHPTTTSAVALALAATSTGLSADIVDIAWDANGRFERSVSVTPAEFAEVCGKLSAGLKLCWSFDVYTPLDFNVHHHVGKDAVFLSKMAPVASMKDMLDMKIDLGYCWM